MAEHRYRDELAMVVVVSLVVLIVLLAMCSGR